MAANVTTRQTAMGDSAIFALLALLLLAVPVLAQKQRPKILPRPQIEFTGRLLLLPRDARPVSWKLPRQIARVANYELLTPPRDLLGDGTAPVDPDPIIAWVKTQDIASLSGVIVALDTLAGWAEETSQERMQQRLELLNWLRQRKPDLPLYGFAQTAHAALSAFVFDDLLLEPPDADAAHLLLARFLHRTYQRPTKILTLASSEVAPNVRQALASSIDAVGGQLLQTGKADVYLFLHTPNTDAAQRTNFVQTLANVVTSGYYVALVDLSGNPESLMTALREDKKLGLLQAYAAAPEPSAALGRAFAQCTARLIAAKVLRPRLAVEQLQRAERAQVELLFTRYLEDWVYPGSVRARVEVYVRESLQVEPQKLGAATEQVEGFANAELRQAAEELFRTQFRYNVHSVLLGSGVRADFQVESLQLFRARFPLQRMNELEISPSIHLSQLIGLNPKPFIKSP